MQRFSCVTMVVTLFLLFAATALAQQHQYGPAKPGERSGYANQPRFAKCPFQGLSEEQRYALRELREAHRQAVMPLALQLRAKQAELDALLAASEADQGKIASVSSEIVDLHGQILAIQNDYRRQVFEKTGRLVRGGMDRMAKGHGQKPSRASMRNCPRLSLSPAGQAE